DVDAAGDVYVAITGDNQVRKLKPIANTFELDSNFGIGGFIGNADKSSGTNPVQFNSPFDVAVTPDRQTIAVSDSGNDRIQRFTHNGLFLASFDGQGVSGRLGSPKGIAFDEVAQ